MPNEPPDAVLFPQKTDEVADAVRICAKHRIPIIPFGVGLSFEGDINAPFGGLSIDTSRMNGSLPSALTISTAPWKRA